MAYELKDYREVPERIAEWYVRYEEGRIVCSILEAFTDETKWTVRAEVYRSSDPAEPPAGVGHSFLFVPGKTNFTRDSELENAETSAAGRALVMAGIPAKNVASENEIASKKSADVEPGPAPTSTGGPEGQPQGAGKADADGSADTKPGEVRGDADPTSGESVSKGEGEGPDDSGSPDTLEEQKQAYFNAFREGPGLPNALMMAKKLFQTETRRIKNWNDFYALSVDELFQVAAAFEEMKAS